MAELIRLENIRKSYGENEVLKNITIPFRKKNLSRCWDRPAAERPRRCGF